MINHSEILPSHDSNPFKAQIDTMNTDGITLGGFVRIQPPFVGSEELYWDIDDDFNVELTHYASDSNATLLHYYYGVDLEAVSNDEITLKDEAYEDAKKAVVNSVQTLIDSLGYVASREMFEQSIDTFR